MKTITKSNPVSCRTTRGSRDGLRRRRPQFNLQKESECNLARNLIGQKEKCRSESLEINVTEQDKIYVNMKQEGGYRNNRTV